MKNKRSMWRFACFASCFLVLLTVFSAVMQHDEARASVFALHDAIFPRPEPGAFLPVVITVLAVFITLVIAAVLIGEAIFRALMIWLRLPTDKKRRMKGPQTSRR